MAQAMHFDCGATVPVMIPGQRANLMDDRANASAWSAAWDFDAYPQPLAQVRASEPKRLIASNDAPAAGMGAPVAGGMSVDLGAEDMDGVWSLRFGTFGCPDSDLRGGVVHIEDGVAVGGDSHFAYLGEWVLKGTELKASLDITRHNDDGDMMTIFGSNDFPYRLECIAEAITSDLFEGRIRRVGFPDARLTMRRIVFRPN